MLDTEMTQIELANERTSIEVACRLVGMEGVSGYGKLYCPFGHLYHGDGGMAKSFRVYLDTNTAYCFGGCGWYSPVRLLGAEKGLSDDDAAEYLLELSGYVAPDLESRWKAAVETFVPINQDSLTEALKVACERMDSNWEIRQFDEAIATRFRQCLELLPRVNTEADATKWLSKTKEIMQQQLGAHHG